MIDDLKVIKKAYGEEMMHLCRELFPTMLELELGKLSSILQKHFLRSRDLYYDIVSNNLTGKFQNYINTMCSNVNEDRVYDIDKDPYELLRSAGYTLYECKSEEDIQSFRKYYSKGEELCTFNGGRLNTCFVYFAVRDDALDLKRSDFSLPDRQDLYGTSVISIQFAKNPAHTLSIKNRYNHTVRHPDATFSNNLDNIVEGLTDSFAKYFGMEQKYNPVSLEIPGYVHASNGKFYKYNIEKNNIYFCEKNVIVDGFIPQELDEDRYIVFDYFILDLVKKTLIKYNAMDDANLFEDTFTDDFSIIEDIKVINKKGGYRDIYIGTVNGKAIIGLNNHNQMIYLYNDVVRRTDEFYLGHNQFLEYAEFPNLTHANYAFLAYNKVLSKFIAPKLEHIGSSFLEDNQSLKVLNLPSVKSIAQYFMDRNNSIEEVYLPQVEYIGDGFFRENKSLRIISTPKLKYVGYQLLEENESRDRLLHIMLTGTEVRLTKKCLSYTYVLFRRLINERTGSRYPKNKIYYLSDQYVLEKKKGIN